MNTTADPDLEQEEPPYNLLTERFPAPNIGVLTHFYRGELARSVAWRQKMDATTHWAILSATALISFTFSSPGIDHVLLMFSSLLLFLLLNIEGRRYRFYDVWRTRVRMLEIHFLVPALVHDAPMREGDWRQMVCEDLFNPTYKISYWEAVGRRLRRNYVWLFLLVLLAWIGKIVRDGEPGAAFHEAAAVTSAAGQIVAPGWVVLGFVVAFHAALLVLVIRAAGIREATGEIRRRDPVRKVWPI